MNIHEYQAKEILAKLSVKVPVGFVASSLSEFDSKISTLSGDRFAVKSQIHAGGRGKAGGVKIAKSASEGRKFFDDMLGSILVTNQTGPSGQKVGRVYIEQCQNIKKEFYLSAIIDRSTARITFIASSEGGMDIEDVAHKLPDKIIRLSIDPAAGMMGFHIKKILYGLGCNTSQLSALSTVVHAMYEVICKFDAIQVELNPLIESIEGDFIALDAKIVFDDNALSRNSSIMNLRDESEEDPAELAASMHGLSYVKMDGTIGCMVNGAGLAMATMDIIKYYGGSPANFLDVGGAATVATVTEAFKIILSDSNVKGLLVNIFGGILRCDIIANGLVNAAKLTEINIPIVARLVGTNYELGNEILRNSGLYTTQVTSFDDAAKEIVRIVSNE